MNITQVIVLIWMILKNNMKTKDKEVLKKVVKETEVMIRKQSD